MMTNHKRFVAALVAVAGAAMPALAQDSVSNVASPQPAGAGDGLPAFDASGQCAGYVVDLTPFTSSWGTKYAIAPIVKSSKTSAGFEGSLVSAQAISANVVQSEFFGTYGLWSTPGQGVNPVTNDPPAMIVSPQGASRQFGVAFSEFSGPTNVITSGVVSFDPNDPLRMYVNRTVAATNSANGTDDNATFGFGAVDEEGNVVFRADDFGVAGNPISGQNLIQVSSLDRDCGVVPQIWDNPAAAGTTNADDAGATIVVIENSATTTPVSNILPTAQGGPVPMGSNFDAEFVHGIPASFDPFPGDTRGSVAFSNRPVFGNAGAVGSIAIFGRDALDNTRMFQVADVDSNSDTVGAFQVYDGNLAVPFTDNSTGFVVPNLSGSWDFDHYHSQTNFNGGTSQLDIGSDQSGNVLACAFVDVLAQDSTHPQGAIAVMRDADGIANGNEEWTLAGYNGDFNFIFTPLGRGKPVLDGPGGNVIGYMSTILEQTSGSQEGPSISPAGFDSVGNVWFVAPIEFIDGPGDNSVDPSSIEICLLRAVYSPADFSYELEVVVKAGDMFDGQNSGRAYMLDLFAFDLADSNSISSGTFYSGNVSDDAFGGMDPSGLSTSDNRTTGGVVLAARAQYDANGDDFISFNGTDAGDDDEEYNVLFYIGADVDVVPVGCAGDLSGDGDTDSEDLNILLASFGQNAGGDLNDDGMTTSTDLNILLADFGCQP